MLLPAAARSIFLLGRPLLLDRMNTGSNFLPHPDQSFQWLGMPINEPRRTFCFTTSSTSLLKAVEGVFTTLTKLRLTRRVFRFVTNLQARSIASLPSTASNPSTAGAPQLKIQSSTRRHLDLFAVSQTANCHYRADLDLETLVWTRRPHVSLAGLNNAGGDPTCRKAPLSSIRRAGDGTNAPNRAVTIALLSVI